MNQDIRRKLDNIAQALFGGGVTNPVTYIDQISYLIFLKLLDEEEDQKAQRARMGDGNVKPLFPGQTERFRWSKWRFKSGKALFDFVRDEVFPYMGSLVKDEPQVAEYFRDAVLEIHDHNVLKEVIDEIGTIQFAKLGTDVKGDIYEYLLTYLGRIDSQTLGQFRTPRQIRHCMIHMLDPDLGDTIYDPACGTAGFLIDSVEYLLAKYSDSKQELPIYGEEWLDKQGKTLEELKREIPSLQTYFKGYGEGINWNMVEQSIFGTDVSRQMMRIAMMNLVLHGIRNANLKRANALSEMGGLSEDDINRRYKVVLANPPFAGALPKESIRSDLPTNSRKSELLFLGLMMKSLAPGGRCAVIVPEGTVFSSTTAHMDLRGKLLNEFEMQAVISLPAGVFKPYAGVKTSVLVFRRPVNPPEEGQSATQQVWFYEILNDGYDPDKIQGGGRPETPEQNDIPGLLKAWYEYKASGFENPPGEEANAILPPKSENPKCWWAKAELIGENGYNLSASRYKPHIGEEVPDDDPVELIEETIELEKTITTELQKLLASIKS